MPPLDAATRDYVLEVIKTALEADDRSMSQVMAAMNGFPRAYVLEINQPMEAYYKRRVLFVVAFLYLGTASVIGLVTFVIYKWVVHALTRRGLHHRYMLWKQATNQQHWYEKYFSNPRVFASGSDPIDPNHPKFR